MLGVVSLAPISSAKRRPQNFPIDLSKSCKAKIGTSILLNKDGQLEQKTIWQGKKKAIIGITVRTLSHSYPNVLVHH
jgi:hypothetical protein